MSVSQTICERPVSGIPVDALYDQNEGESGQFAIALTSNDGDTWTIS
ncbi:hypothetical protein NBRC3257_3341 [Gluconobacter thailandicus NBRC 3257]|uniref:Uncharacterized protein n=1 Tax=Gluconobacter thailandicus NBRC 3257 TaxID=1381097 RepID=A0ABQ0J1M6_GLUTH|nr:hypothetical protein NBRC3255_3075 [Gluconobacter thailandicus NBRC 3255]GAD28342.1 hypothetical protein NBRC3257_3341 [Gluconobacter thailandicus NBRC 3257]